MALSTNANLTVVSAEQPVNALALKPVSFPLPLITTERSEVKPWNESCASVIVPPDISIVSNFESVLNVDNVTDCVNSRKMVFSFVWRDNHDRSEDKPYSVRSSILEQPFKTDASI